MVIGNTYSQHICIDVWRIKDSCYSLNKHKEWYDHQEESINESWQYFHTTKPKNQMQPKCIEAETTFVLL